MMIRRLASLAWAALLSLLAYLPAQAQAIVLDHGQTTLGLSYQHTFVRNHVGFEGTRVDLGHIMAYAIRPEISYGLTDRVTVDADAPFSAGKYIGSNPHGRLDDSTFHSTFQDLHLGLRMNVLMQPLAVTPFLRATIPTHHYQLEGHTATGKGTKELTIGTYAGRELAPWSPDAYVEGMLSHTFVQRTNIDVASERLNRTNGTLEVGYYLLPSITVRAFGTGVRTHGGWDLPRQFGPGEAREHDRFDKTKDIQVGGVISYNFQGGMSIYGGYFTTVWARTAHVIGGPSVGVTWSPKRRQSWLARARTPLPVLIAQQ